jgi:hypothetical protein
MLDGRTHDYSTVGTYTWGFSFRPSNNIVVSHVRHYFGTRISLWNRSEPELLVSQNVVSTPGAWTETALTTPVTLFAGSNYVVAAYASNTTVHSMSYSAIAFPHGAIIQSLYTNTDEFPRALTTHAWPMVGLRYSVASLLPVTITPASSGPFTNGLWSGFIAVTQAVSGVSIVATSSDGSNGSSGPLDVMEAPPEILPLTPPAGQIGFRYATRTGWRYTIECTVRLESDSRQTIWVPLQTTSGDGTVQVFMEERAPGNPQRFYRVRVHE